MRLPVLPLSLCLLLAASAVLAAPAAPAPVKVVMLHICVSEKASSRIEAELAAPLERELREVPGLDSFFSMSMEYGVIFELQFHGGAKEAHRAYVEETAMRSAAGRALGVRHRAVRLASLDDKRFEPILPCRDAPPMQH